MKKFEITDVPDYKYESLEQLGTKRKFWFTDDQNKLKQLFKIGRENTGENWVEVVVSEICELLNIPHAKYKFSTWMGKEGTISENFVPENYRLVHGNELLAKTFEVLSTDIKYPIDEYKVREYQLKLIITLMKSNKLNIQLPIGYENPELDTAFDLFLSYIMLDCLIANSDRHYENWALTVIDDSIALAPTYDHASGLGCRETDQKKQERLDSKDERFQVKGFVKKAKTPFYNREENLKTIDAFKICANANKEIAIYWLEKLEKLDLKQVRRIFYKIPDHLISDVSIEFALKILEENMKRLLEIKEVIKND